jgi:ribosomal protein S12 methylthiotransferase
MKKQKQVFIVSLGCPKNLVDTEAMVGSLLPQGYQLCADIHDADAILVNTCSFIEPARRETLETIGECAEFRRTGRAKALVITGCMAESHRQVLEDNFGEIDAILGLKEEPGVASVLDDLLYTRRASKKKKKNKTSQSSASPACFRVTLTPPHTCYLRIADGCNHSCSFCIIPQIRGPLHSRPVKQVVKEAEDLVAAGAKELNLISQDSTSYGRDLWGKSLLPELLRQLCGIEKLEWIRVLYAYPPGVSDELLDVMASESKVCRYIDVPLQHASEPVLRSMKRPSRREDLEGLVERLRSSMPDIVIRTAFIVGFPGETEEDFQRLVDFCREMEFDYAGCFVYSPEELSSSAGLPDPVPEAVALERLERLNEVTREISFRRISAMEGREARVLIDGESAVFPDFWKGRHAGQAPDVDGVVYVPREAAEPGQMLRCRLTGRHDYDLFAEPLDNS